MKEIHYTCQGESHKAINKVCQDFSLTSITNEQCIGIVCDGHGGSRYFRSDIGAKIAAEVTRDCVLTFLQNISEDIFKDKPFTVGQSLNTEIENNDFRKETPIDRAFRQLFSSIIFNWRERIFEHANNTPISDVESSLDLKWIEAFNNKEGIEKTYGCTLMCFVKTQGYWFAFHIGDGKCIAFNENGQWSEPIPWDDRCFLNKTTSLCDSAALDEFRYCCQGNGSYPLAVCLGSDGMDDSFGETENLANFYIQVLKEINSKGQETAHISIEETLPELSKRGSQDDMSLVCLYDETLLKANVNLLIDWQRKEVQTKINEINRKILELKSKKQSFEIVTITSKKDAIDFDYAKKELERSFLIKRQLVDKYNKFSMELNPEENESYCDEIGLSEYPEDNIGI